MKKLKQTLINLWKDESAQGATEYILILVVVVAIVLAFRQEIEGIVTQKAQDLGNQISNF